MDKLLPTGSVVELKRGPGHLIMVLGYLQRIHGKTYDYLGVLYPNGITGEDSCIAFQETEIGRIVFEGYRDEEGLAFTTLTPRLVREAAMETAGRVQSAADRTEEGARR